MGGALDSIPGGHVCPWEIIAAICKFVKTPDETKILLAEQQIIMNIFDDTAAKFPI